MLVTKSRESLGVGNTCYVLGTHLHVPSKPQSARHHPISVVLLTVPRVLKTDFRVSCAAALAVLMYFLVMCKSL